MPRDRARRGARPAPRGSARAARALLDARRDRPRRRRARGCSTPPTAARRVPAPPACCAHERHGDRVPPRARAARRRGRDHAARAAWRCTAQALGGARGRAAPTPRGSRITPRRRATPDAVLTPRRRRGRRARRPLGRAPRGGGAVRPRAALRDGCRRERAELLERRAYQCYLTDQIEEAIEARARGARLPPRGRRPPARGRRAALALAPALVPRPQRRGRAVRRRGGRAARAARARPRAGDGLQQPRAAPDARRRRRGRQPLGRCRRSSWRSGSATTETLVHALNNVGTAEAARGRPGGLGQARAQPGAGARARARGARRPRLLQPDLDPRAPARAGRPHRACFADALGYCRTHDLGSWAPYIASWQRASRSCDDGRLGRRPRTPPHGVLRDPRRVADQPHLGARRARLPARAPRRPRGAGAARGGARARRARRASCSG